MKTNGWKGRDWERDRYSDRDRGIGSQTQGQKDRDNWRWTMEQTQGQTAMDMEGGTQTGAER